MTTLLEVTRGDTFKRFVTLKLGLVGKDITGYKFYFAVKKTPSNVKDDNDALILKDITDFVDVNGGKFLLHLTPSDTDVQTGDYYYGIQYKKPDGSIQSTKGFNIFRINPDINRRTN